MPETPSAYRWWKSDYTTPRGIQDALTKGALGALWLSVALIIGWFRSDMVLAPISTAEGVGDVFAIVLAAGIGPLLAWRIKRGGMVAAWISFILLGVALLVWFVVLAILYFHGKLYHLIVHDPVPFALLFVTLVAWLASHEGMSGAYKLHGKKPPGVGKHLQ